MRQLLKRVQEWAFGGGNSSDSSSNSLHKFDDRGSVDATSSNQTIISSSSPNVIKRLPLDIFIKILKLLDPKDAAKLTSVCKSWKRIVSDDKLWRYFLQNQQDHWLSTFFAETKLRSGFPLRTCPRRELAFMRIYGERVKVPGAIIIDGGTGYCKFGWSKYDSPFVRVTVFVEFANMGTSLEDNVYQFFATIYTRMRVYPSRLPVIITTPIFFYSDVEASNRQYTETVYSVLSKMEVPAICKVNHATLAMFSARRTWGILVNIGFYTPEVSPILYGEIKHRVGVVSMGVGGFDLTGYLSEKLEQRNVDVSSLYTVRSLKEKLCYVALDYEAELLKDTEASCRVDSSGLFTLKQERFKTWELLFQPQIVGINKRGLHHAVAQCMIHCGAVNTEENKDSTAKKDAEVQEARATLYSKLEVVGNLVHDSVPVSKDEANNAVVRTWGEKRLEPKVKNHVELVELLGIADLKRGANVAGGRGYYLKGDGVDLNQALINFGLDFLKKRGYTKLQTPFFMKKDIVGKCAQLAQFDEELYKVTGEGYDKYLIATAEQPLCAYHIDDWIHPTQLPLRSLVDIPFVFSNSIFQMAQPQQPSFDDLHEDLQVEIATLVGQHSIKDLLNLRQCNILLFNTTHERDVMNKVSIDSQWTYAQWGREMEDPEDNFLKQCHWHKNTEVLWSMGMHHYFSMNRCVEGREYIKEAANQGHHAAHYTLGMILMSEGEEDVEEAFKMFNKLLSELETRIYVVMTAKVRACLDDHWVNKRLVVEGMRVKCWNRRHTTQYILEEARGFDKEIDTCSRCKWWHEFVEFYRMMEGL